MCLTGTNLFDVGSHKLSALLRKDGLLWMGGLSPSGGVLDSWSGKTAPNASSSSATESHFVRFFLALGLPFITLLALDRENFLYKLTGELHKLCDTCSADPDEEGAQILCKFLSNSRRDLCHVSFFTRLLDEKDRNLSKLPTQTSSLSSSCAEFESSRRPVCWSLFASLNSWVRDEDNEDDGDGVGEDVKPSELIDNPTWVASLMTPTTKIVENFAR